MCAATDGPGLTDGIAGVIAAIVGSLPTVAAGNVAEADVGMAVGTITRAGRAVCGTAG